MQDGHDDLGRRAPLFRVYVHRNTAAIIADRDRLIRVNRDCYYAAISRQSLVDRVVDNLKNHVVQPGAIICVADVHAGAFSNGLKAL